jgi:hypothetical protein
MSLHAVDPCPEWCETGSEHGTRRVDVDVWERSHEAAYSQPDKRFTIYVQEFESITWDCTRTVEPIGVQVIVEDRRNTTYSADQCRRIAAALLNAADKLDEIQGGAR